MYLSTVYLSLNSTCLQRQWIAANVTPSDLEISESVLISPTMVRMEQFCTWSCTTWLAANCTDHKNHHHQSHQSSPWQLKRVHHHRNDMFTLPGKYRFTWVHNWTPYHQTLTTFGYHRWRIRHFSDLSHEDRHNVLFWKRGSMCVQNVACYDYKYIQDNLVKWIS